jgi:hypothetical protein
MHKFQALCNVQCDFPNVALHLDQAWFVDESMEIELTQLHIDEMVEYVFVHAQRSGDVVERNQVRARGRTSFNQGSVNQLAIRNRSLGSGCKRASEFFGNNLHIAVSLRLVLPVSSRNRKPDSSAQGKQSQLPHVLRLICSYPRTEVYDKARLSHDPKQGKAKTFRPNNIGSRRISHHGPPEIGLGVQAVFEHWVAFWDRWQIDLEGV